MKKTLCSVIFFFFGATVQYGSIAQSLDSYLQACTDLGYFSGSVLIAKDGHIILSKGYGLSNHEHGIYNKPSTCFRLSSLSKPFVSLAIMQLQEKGMLSVKDRLSTYIPDYPRGAEITIHHLLTHTSGIPNYTTIPDFQTFKKNSTSIIELIERFKYLDLVSKPGTVYKFCNSNYALLCFIIEQISGQSHYTYIQENIFQPAGMMHTGYDIHTGIVPERASGYRFDFDTNKLINADYVDITAAVGLGSFYSTVEDMYLFNQALNTQLLARSDSLITLFTPYAQIGDKEDNIMYGYGWATITLAGHTVKKHIATIDGFSSAMYCFSDAHIFIVVLSNFQHSLTEPMSFDLAAILCDKPYEKPTVHTPIDLDARLYPEYVGSYEYKGQLYTIELKNNVLIFKQSNNTYYQLIAESETHFFIKGTPLLLRFIKDGYGGVVQLITKVFGKERILIKR